MFASRSLVACVLVGACGGGAQERDLAIGEDALVMRVDASGAVDASTACDGDCADLAQTAPPDLSLADLSVGTCSAGAHTITGDTSRPANSTFVIGEPVTLTFAVSGSCTTVSLQIVDENNQVIAEATAPIENGKASYVAPSNRQGYYRVNAKLADGTAPARLATRPAGFMTYAIVPDPAKRTDYGDELSHFGMQGGFAAAQGDVIPYLGIRYVLGTYKWTDLEKNNAGQLAAELAQNKYPATQPVVDAVTYNGQPWHTYEIGQLASAAIPAWAGPVAGTAGTQCTTFGALNADGVSGLPGFATAYAQYFAKTFASQKTHLYQVTWEPETPWCFGGSGAQLEQYYALVYDNIHKADPNALVMGPTLFHGDATELDGLYSAGFGTVIDAFSMHPYATWPFEKTTFIADVRTQMAQANKAAGKTIPFVGTEHGLTSASIGELDEALGDIREEIALIGEGFIHDYSFFIADFWDADKDSTQTSNTYGFYWNLDPNISEGTDKIGPKPAVPALAALTFLLDGSTTKGAMSNVTGTQMGYRFLRGSSTTLALWDYGAASSKITLTTPTESVQVCDWMGNCSMQAVTGNLTLTLGPSPLYVIGAGL